MILLKMFTNFWPFSSNFSIVNINQFEPQKSLFRFPPSLLLPSPLQKDFSTKRKDKYQGQLHRFPPEQNSYKISQSENYHQRFITSRHCHQPQEQDKALSPFYIQVHTGASTPSLPNKNHRWHRELRNLYL